jgi:phage-related protein
MADRKVQFDIIANDRASKTLDHVGSKFGKLGSIGATAGKAVALGIGGAAVGGVLALGAAMKTGITDAANYQTLAAKTAAVLKSTGNAAGTSVKHIQGLAGSLESLSGVDEELIINSQNVLATFTNVQNAAGKGNDIFDQATKAALNMSTALGTDLQGSTLQLGKALNDPIKGITALSRVGVSFTQKQKDTIKALAESGDKMGAQKLILAELSKEFGGAAEAAGAGFSGSLARLQDTLGDTFRSLGEKLLPKLTEFANWLNAKALPAVIAFGEAAGPKLAGAWKKVQPALKSAGDALKSVGSALVDTGKVLVKYQDIIVPIAAGVLAMVGAWKAYTTVTKVVTAVTKAYAAAQAVMNVVLAANPVGLVVLAVVGLGVALYVAWRKSETFRLVVTTAFQAIGAAATWLWTGLKQVFGWLGDKLSAIGGAIKGFFVAAFRTAINLVLGYLGLIIDGAAAAFGWIPGIGPKLKYAQKQFRQFRDSVNNSLAGIQKTVYINVKAYSGGVASTIRRDANSANSREGRSARAFGGGIVGGMTYRVNEAGQELLKLSDRSAAVIPHTQSQRMLRQGGGGGGDTHIHIHGSVLAERDALAFIDRARARASANRTYVRPGA